MSSNSGANWNFGTRLGITFVVQAACSSALAVAGTLLFIGHSAINVNHGRWSIETHIHYYFLNLMIFDLIKAIGGIMSIKWIVQAVITQGPFCTAQGAIKQFGNLGVALTSLTIAVHTFSVLVFRWRSPIIIAPLIIGLIWVFVSLVIGVSFATHNGQVYYGDAKYWCWITARYPAERIGLEYLWMWVAALVDIFVYIFLALVVTGFVTVHGGKIRITTGGERVPISLTSSHSSAGRRDGATMAAKLLFYPAVYVITIFPFAVVRFITFNNPKVPVPIAATVFASMLFSSSGLFNVILFAFTRPNLLRIRGPSAPLRLEPPPTTYIGPRITGGWEISPDRVVGDFPNNPRSFLP